METERESREPSAGRVHFDNQQPNGAGQGSEGQQGERVLLTPRLSPRCVHERTRRIPCVTPSPPTRHTEVGNGPHAWASTAGCHGKGRPSCPRFTHRIFKIFIMSSLL